MKNLKFLLLFILMSCSASKVYTDYDSKTDFSKFKTFDFYEDNGDNLNDFDVKRITSIIENELENTGLNYNQKPDFFIYFDTKTTESQNNNTIGIGLGTGGRNGGIGVSGGIPIGGKKLDEEISIRFINAVSNDLFWEASLTSTIKEKRTPEERILYLQKVISKILSNYPPKE
jgi:hypothetical protein